MTPLAYYYEQCKIHALAIDTNQLNVLHHLDILQHDLIQEHKRRSSLLSLLRKPRLIKGLYLWGGVGIGKTFLMDCFYQSMPFANKKRMHFHQFMRFIHQQAALHQGEKDPLNVIAKELAKNCLLLCFDEVVVADIADAMLIGRLLQKLFLHGVCIVATSNQMPDDLYKKGLQRQLFLPAIESIKKHTSVMHITTTIDYRLQHLKNTAAFFTPNDSHAKNKMEEIFSMLTDTEEVSYLPVNINDRSIAIVKEAHDIIWFNFNVLCFAPRSQHDYLVIAEKYSTVLVSDVTQISADEKNLIALFIRMIDIFYDMHVRLIFSAEVSIEQIYTEGYLLTDFKRTRSRLIEMQSEKYLISRERK